MTSIILLHMLALGQIVPPIAPPLRVIQLAQVTPVKSVQSIIQWTPPKTNEDGSVLTDLKGYLLSVAPDGIDLNNGSPAIQTMKVEGVDLPACLGDVCEFPGDRLFEDLDGGSFRIWIQAYDAVNFSKFALPSDAFTLDVTIPNAPTGLKVDVKVIVEIRISSP